MSDPRSNHPPSERLVAFAEGKLADPLDVESHLDSCAECANAVLIARQLACLDGQQLIPPLTAVERDGEKERLRNRFKLDPLETTVAEGAVPPTRSLPTARPGSGKWKALGALAAAVGLGHGSMGPKPVLALSEPPVPPVPGKGAPHSPDGGEHGGPATDSENSGQAGETPGHHAVSPQQNMKSESAGEIDAFLEQIQEILGGSAPELHDLPGPPPADPDRIVSGEAATDADFPGASSHESGGDSAASEQTTDASQDDHRDQEHPSEIHEDDTTHDSHDDHSNHDGGLHDE